MIAFDAFTNGGVIDPGTSLTWSHTCTGSNLVLVVGGLQSTNTDKVSGITYNTVAMTKAQFIGTSSGPARGSQLYTLTAPATGAHNVVASFSSTTFAGSSTSYTGCAQTGQPDESNSSFVLAGSSITTSIASQASGSWVVGCTSEILGSGTGYGVGSNTTSRGLNNGFGTNFLMIDSNGTTTTSLVFQWTGLDNALMCVAELKVLATATVNSGFFNLM